MSGFSYGSFTILSAVAQNAVVQNTWFLTEWISLALGLIINFIYNIISSLPNALGFSIIIFTFVVRALMFPLGIKQQKSMAQMQQLTPEVEKIKKKYGNSKDPEAQQKMNADIQKLYAKHKVNPFGGCLPLLIQMPIFFALIYIMQNTHLFIDKILVYYARIYDLIKTVPGYTGILNELFQYKIKPGLALDYSTTKEFGRIMNVFTEQDWASLFSQLPPNITDGITELLQQKDMLYMFFGVDLRSNAGWMLPGIMIPILTGLTTFLSSWLMSKQQSAASSDPQQKMTQNMMMIFMPLMMAYMTVNFPVGVGIYWIASNVFQVAQQFILNKYFGTGVKKEV